MRANAKNNPKADLKDYPFFVKSSFGRQWISQNTHRVLTIGYPEQCATYNATWRYNSLTTAIWKALSECLTRVSKFSQHLGRRCGCRVAAVDYTLLVSPDDIPFNPIIPAIALVKDKRGRREIAGYLATDGRTGKNQAIEFRNQDNTVVCRGFYNIGKLDFQGDAHVDCFDGAITGDALFRTGGFHGLKSYGTALLKAGDNEVIIIYGLTKKQFDEKRTEILEVF